MAFNMKKLAEMAKPRSEGARERACYRKENRGWLRMSQEIALCLRYYLRESGMTQKDLADKMGVSAVYVGKLLKGGENLTLETIYKIQRTIGQDLISVVKPYICNMLVSISPRAKFSSNSISSDRFSDKQQLKDDYVLATTYGVA